MRKNTFIKTLILAIVMVVGSGSAWGQTTIFSESMGTPTGTTTIATYATGTAPATFQNKGTLTYSNGAQTNPADLRVTSVSSTYAGFSAGGNVYFTSTNAAYGFSIEGINASTFSSLNLQFGYRKESASLHATFSVDYWNGTVWTTIANTASALFNETATTAAGWYLSKVLTLPVDAQISTLKLRFVKTGTASIRVDDVILKGTATSLAPTVTTPTVTSITDVSAVLGGNITNDGGSAITSRGTVWKTSTGVTISDNLLAEGGTATGTFSHSRTTLPSGSQIFYKAYAINGVGTTLSTESSFYTLSTEPINHSTTFTATALNSTQIDLAFDAGSANAAGYIILRKTGSLPTGIPADATAYTVGNAIGDGTVAAIISNNVSTTATISSLTGGLQYYFSIYPYNGSAASINYKTDGIVQTANATTQTPLDATSEISGPELGSQPNLVSISSLVTTDGAAVRVLDMNVYDYATTDAQSTKITQVTIKAGTNNTANWATTIQGVKLSIDGGSSFVTIGTPTISASSIVIPISSGNLEIPNNDAKTISLYIYLKSSGLTDNQILEFKVDATAASHGFTADLIGTTFLPTFSTAPVSKQIMIDVVASKFNFYTQPANTTLNTNFSASVEALDANNNRDEDATTSVTLAASTGVLSAVEGLTKSLIAGLISWTDLQNNTVGTGITLSATGALATATSNSFNILSSKPSTQASTFIFSNVGTNSMTVSWINGDGEKRMVVAKSTGTAVVPTNGTTYTANTVFGSGSSIGATEYVIYNGTGNSVDITGLSGSTTYSFKVYEYNGAGGTENYLTTGSATTQTTSALTYYSNGSGDPTLLTSWKTNRDGSGSSPVNFTSGEIFVIENGDNMTTTAIWAISGTNSKLWIENGGTLTANHTITLASATTFQIDNGGNYFQNVAMSMTSTIFQGTEVFAANSNFTITVNPGGATLPSAPGYGNLILNITTGATAFGWSGNLSSIQGNLIILGTGINTTRHALTGTGATTTNIGGNFVVMGGNLWLSSGAGTNTVNVSGDLIVNGGTLDIANSSGACIINVGGNVSVTSGTLTEAGSTTTSKIVFNKNGTQTFTSGGTISNVVNFELATTSILDLGTSVISGAGAFTLPAGATLKTANATGVAGSVTVSGTKTFNAGANYIFNGSSAQTIGTLVTTANSVEINNSAGVNIAGNMTMSGLTINVGSILNIPSTKQLTVSMALTNNGTLNLLSNATGTGTILTPATISGTGTANVQQYLTGALTSELPSSRFWYLSSPVTGATSSTFAAAGRNKIWNYKESIHGYNEINANDSILTVGRGYAVRMGADTTVTFTGTLNTGDKTIYLSRTDGNEKSGYNLIGNPYPSFLDWHAATVSASVLPTSIWTRSCTAGGAMEFDTYNASLNTGVSGSGNTVTQYIAPMQAFWVKVTYGNTTGSVSFTNAMRSINDVTLTTNKLKVPALETQQLLRLQVSNGTNSDETVIAFNANASDSFDNYDSPKMSNNNVAIPEIYTLAGTEKVAINGMKNIATMPLGFTTGETNSFSIKATEISNFDADTKVILKDNLLNTEQDITDGTAYSFTSDASTGISRFSIVFKTVSITTGIDNNFVGDLNVNIFKNANGLITVNSNDILGAEGTVTVCNAIGQKLVNTATTGTKTVINKTFSSGVYFVTLNVAGNNTTKKIIIN